jgi:micrococcal nuclease
MHRLKLLSSITFVGLLVFSIGSGNAIAQTLTGTIVSVGDGDTVRVGTVDKTLTVRLGCIDAPEMGQIPYGQAAANRLKQLLPVAQLVSLKVIDLDHYGRSVAKVYKGNSSINLFLVQEGQAVVYRQYLSGCSDLRDRLFVAEASAKQRRLGLWVSVNPVMPWDFRHLGRSANSYTGGEGRSSVVSYPKRYSCKSFKTQAEAQQILNAYPGDPFRLDKDKDGKACESLK